jgi:hypothetical protein
METLRHSQASLEKLQCAGFVRNANILDLALAPALEGICQVWIGFDADALPA